MMNRFIMMVEPHSALFFSLPLLWLSFLIMASIVYRKSRDKPILPSKPKDSLYYEGFASGHSNSNIFTKLGGANNCLQVVVTDDTLIIRPRFPFTLMFLPEIYGLEYCIPLLNIRAVEKKSRLFRVGLEITFIDAEGGEKSVSLYLRKTDEFLSAIGKLPVGPAHG